MRLRWTAHARQDLLEIGRYIARDDRQAARRWVQSLRERAQKAAEVPGTGRIVPEFRREDLREVLLRSYRIVYQVQAASILVLAVFEGHREFPDGRV